MFKEERDLKNFIQSSAEDNKLDDSGMCHSTSEILLTSSKLKKFFLACFKFSGLPFPCI